MRRSDLPSTNHASDTADSRDWSTSSAYVRIGLWLVAGLCVVILGFGSVVSINGAVVTSGTVTVESRYQTVQHLDGGLVQKIHVENGDRVAAGDILVTLDKTANAAELGVLEARISGLTIQRLRLEAERDDKADFQVPATLRRTPELRAIVASQRALFAARQATRGGEDSMLARRVSQLEAQLDGLEAQRTARISERDLAYQERDGLRQLFKKGYANKQRLNAIERQAARLAGDVGRLESEVARVKVAISEARLAKAQARTAFLEKVVDELRRIQQSIEELETQKTAIADKVARAVIRAPRSGTVHALAVNTEGGVIEAARPILQIIPADERLIVLAHVRPRDIDKVRAGLDADVRFTAFQASQTPRLTGTVLRVSPAELQSSDGATYFTTQIAIAPAELSKIGGIAKLVPGMPADVFIRTEARSILSYILKPLTDSMAGALR